MFEARVKWYFNTPAMLARIGKWRNDTLARVGAYGRGVFRNKLSRPQLQQTRERTVRIRAILTKASSARIWQFDDVVFVPRRGLIVSMTTGQPVPKPVALKALKHVASQVRWQGAGKPPRMGPSQRLRRFNDFQLDPVAESVVIGTVPFPPSNVIAASSVPQLLDQGMKGWINNRLLPGGSVFAEYAERPYVDSVMGPALTKLEQLIERRQAG